MSSNPNANDLAGAGLLIGSFPHRDHREATDLILKYTPEIPCWPQLPARGEGMLVQFSRGLPGFDPEGLRVDPEAPNFEEEKLRFYEEYLAVTEAGRPLSETRFALSPEETPGLYVLLEEARGGNFLAVKGQITGPFTLATGLKFSDGRALFYDPEMRDMVGRLVALKARFQIETLKALSPRVILFLDEPALSGFGSSAFVGVSREEVLASLAEVIREIHRAGGLAGVHVCGNTDWSLLLESPFEIINFDAYDFSEKFISYAQELKEFFIRGGWVAWGLVPTLRKEALEKETVEGLFQKFRSLIQGLAEKTGLAEELLLQRSLLTPSCGMGTLSLSLTLKALELLKGLSERVKNS
ncbi:hypothetical protein FVE67_00290 [Thermosulfurimonas marina]|uniref:Methionine synthase n=1 Tax=Thermosulfurimonas marina TaxID=2047767 RepID=A0A6H1WQ18_9BACT|nr:hypothetical protein [Thermosulfurimonas marina]QJA05317.1 hypothetical protein FVE67_00290 [Thermosulfurimonas marina]